jgi:hypothetical protein
VSAAEGSEQRARVLRRAVRVPHVFCFPLSAVYLQYLQFHCRLCIHKWVFVRLDVLQVRLIDCSF